MTTLMIYFTCCILLISFVLSKNIELSQEDNNLSNFEPDCDISNCPFTKGICYNNKCLCSYQYYTHIDEDSTSIMYCNYKRRSHMIAMFLEFFFMFGVGHVYARNYFLGFYKFLVIFTMLSFHYASMCKGNCTYSGNSEERNTESNITHDAKCSSCQDRSAKRLEYVSDVLMKIIIAWYLFDLVCYGANIYTDGNGEELI